MANVRLEINSIKINRPKKRWKLYFVVMIENPEDRDKMLVGVHPTDIIKLKPSSENEYHFDGKEEDREGMFIFSRQLPEDRKLNVHIYVRHSRKGVRNAGEIMGELAEKLKDENVESTIINIASSASPWLAVSKVALPIVGEALKKVKDRDLGFISAYERFGAEFELDEEIDIRKDSSSTDATMVYTWSIDD